MFSLNHFPHFQTGEPGSTWKSEMPKLANYTKFCRRIAKNAPPVRYSLNFSGSDATPYSGIALLPSFHCAIQQPATMPKLAGLPVV
jgi:hypothetical protein